MKVDTDLDVDVEITHHLFGYNVKIISMNFYIVIKFVAEK